MPFFVGSPIFQRRLAPMAGWNSRDPLKASSKASLPKEPAKSKDLAPRWRIRKWPPTTGNGNALKTLATHKTTQLVGGFNTKTISQIGSFPQVGVKIKNIWNHHVDKHEKQKTCQSERPANAAKPCDAVSLYLPILNPHESTKERSVIIGSLGLLNLIDDFSVSATRTVYYCMHAMQTKSVSNKNYTPENNMELENTPLEKEKHQPKPPIFEFHVSFLEVHPQKSSSQGHLSQCA